MNKQARETASELLGRYGGDIGRRALMAVSAAQLAEPMVRWVRLKRRQRDYTVSVGGSDDIYPDLHEWLLAQIPASERRAMLLDTYDDGADLAGVPMTRDQPPAQSGVKLRYDGSRVQRVRLNGHLIWVSVTREDLPGGRENLASNWRRYLEKIQFTCTSLAAREAVVAMIEQLVALKYSGERSSRLLLPSRWGGDWQPRADLRSRTLDSVILKRGQSERLVADLDRFLNREEEYTRLCQPWHRGYLFYGSPGTGKTSVARALAHHFGMSVYYLPLADLKADASLTSLMQQVPPRSMLLLEDVDVYHAATERQDDLDRVSLAALLNTLDGVWTPHGLITVLTTNHLDSLDEALLRAGRVDVREEFTVLDAEQIERVIAYVGGSAIDGAAYIGRPPADLMEAIHKGANLMLDAPTTRPVDRVHGPCGQAALELALR